MKKIMLIYPPNGRYQRGEERCQIDAFSSSANNLRACNDLGIAAAVLKKEGFSVFLRDYPAENASFKDLKNDINRENPEAVFMSITNGSIFDDLDTVREIKDLKPDIKVILKGALFFNPDKSLFEQLDLNSIDVLTGAEFEFILARLFNAAFENTDELKHIDGISYKSGGKWVSNKLINFNENLDGLPFPDRSLMKNELYVNPLSNKPMAVISAARGCPSKCIYCLSPVISGRKVRFRSTENVLEEIKECVYKYGITDFFFKSDTFTINKKRVMDLCSLIIKSGLKINWAANSRADTLDEEMLLKMKEAGCSLIALGLESGSEESLLKMSKGVSVQQNRAAVHLIKKCGIKIWGFYLIGFPWETKQHLEETKKLMFELDADFIELSIAVPFKGSRLYEMTGSTSDVLGKDSFKNTAAVSKYLTKKELETFRKRVLIEYHLRPEYILNKLFDKTLTPALFFNYVKYGLRLLKNNLMK